MPRQRGQDKLEPTYLNTKPKIKIEAQGRYRKHAGAYDPKTCLPQYGFEVVAPDAETKDRVIDESHAMGHINNFFWVWDIKNNSNQIVFITLTKDGAPL